MQMLAHSFCEPPVAQGPRRLGFRAAWWRVGIAGCVSNGVSSPLRVRVSHCASICPHRGACDLHMSAEQSPTALLVTSKMESYLCHLLKLTFWRRKSSLGSTAVVFPCLLQQLGCGLGREEAASGWTKAHVQLSCLLSCSVRAQHGQLALHGFDSTAVIVMLCEEDSLPWCNVHTFTQIWLLLSSHKRGKSAESSILSPSFPLPSLKAWEEHCLLLSFAKCWQAQTVTVHLGIKTSQLLPCSCLLAGMWQRAWEKEKQCYTPEL